MQEIKHKTPDDDNILARAKNNLFNFNVIIISINIDEFPSSNQKIIGQTIELDW